MAGHRADMMKLVKLAKKAGCTAIRTGTGHWKITTPSGAVIITSFSPSTAGAYRDTVRALRREGVFK
jgi:hypothetical protein